MNSNNYYLRTVLGLLRFASFSAFFFSISTSLIHSAQLSDTFGLLEPNPQKNSSRISRSPAVENIISVEMEQRNQKSHPFHPAKTSFNFPENSRKGQTFMNHERGPNQLRKLATEFPSTSENPTLGLKNLFLIIFLILVPFSLSYLISHHLFPLKENEETESNASGKIKHEDEDKEEDQDKKNEKFPKAS